MAVNVNSFQQNINNHFPSSMFHILYFFCFSTVSLNVTFSSDLCGCSSQCMTYLLFNFNNVTYDPESISQIQWISVGALKNKAKDSVIDNVQNNRIHDNPDKLTLSVKKRFICNTKIHVYWIYFARDDIRHPHQLQPRKLQDISFAVNHSHISFKISLLGL